MTRNDQNDTAENDTRLTASRRRVLTGVAGVTGAALAPTMVQAQETTQTQAQGVTPEVVAQFEPPNLPENIATDSEGNVYVSMAPAHQIWQVPPEGEPSSVATIGSEGGDGLLLGVTRADDGTMYAALNSGVSETHGVWQVPTDGEAERMASIPTDGTFPNGVTHEGIDDGVLVTDSRRGAIWQATSDGAEVWFDHELLAPSSDANNPIGVNGIALGPEGDYYVANLNDGAIVRIPMSDGSPGEPEVVVQDDTLVGADGLTVADDRTVYTAVNSENKVSRVTPDGTVETVAQGGELAFPSDVHFGPDDDQSTLYVCNFSLPSFEAEDQEANPALLRIDLGGAADGETTAEGDETTAEGDETAAAEGGETTTAGE